MALMTGHCLCRNCDRHPIVQLLHDLVMVERSSLGDNAERRLRADVGLLTMESQVGPHFRAYYKSVAPQL